MSGRALECVQYVSGRYQECVWFLRVSGRCLEGIRKVSEGLIEGA